MMAVDFSGTLLVVEAKATTQSGDRRALYSSPGPHARRQGSSCGHGDAKRDAELDELLAEAYELPEGGPDDGDESGPAWRLPSA